MVKGLVKMTVRGTAWLGLAAMLVALAPQAKAAWPEKPIKFVLPFGAGGVADVTARILADKLSQKLNQRVVVENMPGPGGIAAARAVITAPADGYTMAWVTNGAAISVATFQNLPFDPVKDFAMVSMAGTFDLVFVVNDQSEYKTLADVIKAAKDNPGKMNIGTIAVGSTQNLGAELFKSLTGLNIQIVPYKNSPDIVVALLRNDVDDRLPSGGCRTGCGQKVAHPREFESATVAASSRSADCRPGRRQRLRGDLLERGRSAQGHTERSHRYDE
jgi:tripartite-type tricarboxylate transporter receptor subunit TctC